MPDIYALIPAAGVGARVGGVIPKQYQTLAGKPMICHALETLCAHAAVRKVFVVLAPSDSWFGDIVLSTVAKAKLTPLYCGGATRAASVTNGLAGMSGTVRTDDWVLVHDAARPCLVSALIDRLLAELSTHEVGGLLAVPVADTLKRADDTHHVQATTPREHLWQAQTPQMFRHGLLLEALRRCGPDQVTDESSALEQMGARPRLVMGSPRNVKVTQPEDLLLAETLLK